MFHVLQKFTVPRGLKLTCIAPKYSKFGQPAQRVLTFDAGHCQHLEYLLTGLPARRHRAGLGAVAQASLKPRPPAANPANELTVDFPRRPAALPPVKNKLRSYRVDELLIHPRAGHDFQCIKAGLPVLIKGRGRGNFKRLVMPLLVPPGGEDVLSKPALSTVSQRARIEVDQLLLGELSVDAMVHL